MKKYMIKQNTFKKIVTLLLTGGFLITATSCSGREEAEPEVEPYVTSNGVPFEPKSYYPDFNWDQVPVYKMFAYGDRMLNDAEVRTVAAETGFICIEKNHGLKDFGDAVLGLKHEQAAFTAVNPDVKVLAYLNSALAYPFTRYTKGMTPDQIDQHPEMKEFMLTNSKTGELEVFIGQLCLNVLNPDMRAWWSDAGADMVREGNADGIFIDQMHGFAWLHPPERYPEVLAGVADMMQQLKDKIGQDKMFLANNAAHLDSIFPIADAFMFEHYDRKATHTKEQLLEDWRLMAKIADAGKITIYRFGATPDPGTPLADHTDWADKNIHKLDEYAELSQEQIEFYLALYLIGAQPYSYFQWNWEWDLRSGPIEHYADLHKPLGQPKGAYTRVHPDQWEFTREFEHASVWVDTEKWEAKIDWKSGEIPY